jgi:hypothetical protein
VADNSIAISRLKSSSNVGQLVAVMGTGASMALTGGKNKALSWRGLVENGFDYGVAKGTITDKQRSDWRSQLNSYDLDELLSAAEFMGRKLGAPAGGLYARWLQEVFKEVTPEEKGMANAIRALQSTDIPICTLNYDLLLEQVTGLPSINLTETTKVVAWMRREEKGILHLHGIWNTPATCILGIRDYESTLNDEFRDLTQRALNLERFATDRPDQFLKRVELRSGLLVEAGYQLDGARAVPFYQFRHLTFQEHLAAVAAAGGHYIGYQIGDTLLTPLAPHLTAEEWKEVVPMAAVLAKKQAEPLIASLVAQSEPSRAKLEEGEEYQTSPAPVARLAQCLAEEAEASTETLTSALQIIALFARGFGSGNNWQELRRGPYARELLEQA